MKVRTRIRNGVILGIALTGVIVLGISSVYAFYDPYNTSSEVIPSSAQQFKNPVENIVKSERYQVRQFLIETKEDGTAVITSLSGDTIVFVKERNDATMEIEPSGIIRFFIEGKKEDIKVGETYCLTPSGRVISYHLGFFEQSDDGSALLERYVEPDSWGRKLSIDISSEGKISSIKILHSGVDIYSTENVNIVGALKSNSITLKSEVAGSPTITFGVEGDIEVTASDGKIFSLNDRSGNIRTVRIESVIFDADSVTIETNKGFSLILGYDGKNSISVSSQEEIDKEGVLLLVDLARQDEALKSEIAQELDLSGKHLEIWHDFIILVKLKGRQRCSAAALNTKDILSIIHSNLEMMPSEIRELVKGIEIARENVMFVHNGVLGIVGGGADENYIILHISPYETSSSVVSGSFFHELGHIIDDYGSTLEQWEEFDRLFKASGENIENYAREYGMLSPHTGRRHKNHKEDFATMFEAYMMNSEGLLDRAGAQAENGNPILLEKVKIISGCFAHEKEENNEGHLGFIEFIKNLFGFFKAETKEEEEIFTFIYNNGMWAEVELGEDGLPVIPENVDWKSPDEFNR